MTVRTSSASATRTITAGRAVDAAEHDRRGGVVLGVVGPDHATP